METKSEENLETLLKQQTDETAASATKLYKIRWFILLLFVLYAASSAMQWIQYCVISDVIMKYYGVSALAVDWTSLISMVTYPPLIIPGSFIIDKMGLRVCALLGVIGTTIGTWVKVFSVQPHLFWVGFAGQTIVFVSQIFILSLPPRIASLWFGPNEVSTACSLGVFGTQLGTAVGFIAPPYIVQNSDNLEEIGESLSLLFKGVAWYTTPIAILVILYFKSEPEVAPSQAQLDLRRKQLEFSRKEFYNSYKWLLTNKPFLILMLAYGMNIGVFAGVCTVLNQFILHYFPNGQKDSGNIGLLMVVVGMGGSLFFGAFLDRTKKYKETTLWIYIMVTLGIAAFSLSLKYQSMICVYASAAFMGFFQNAYYPVGFELATELTFPQPESTSSGLLTSSAQTFGVAFTLLMDSIFKSLGAFWALASMVFLLAIGCILTAITPNILKRQEALRGASNKTDI